MKYHAFLIKYAEIGIKGKNRYHWERAVFLTKIVLMLPTALIRQVKQPPI